MPSRPLQYPSHAAPCDPRLPQAALDFRLRHAPPLTTARFLGGINITAWLYQDKAGVQGIQVNPNTTIEELIRQFGPAETPDAEVGIHSEGKAGEWFRLQRHLRVLQIFSERIPCPMMCGPMLRREFPGVPWYYYYNRQSWIGEKGRVIRYPAETLKFAYGL
jgi:hypothetical protein